MGKSKLHIIEFPKEEEISIEFRSVSPYHHHENLPKQVSKGSKFIFDFIDRRIIIDFYKNYPNGSYWKKPLVVERFERLKALKEFEKELKKELGKFLNPVLDFIERKIISFFNNDKRRN